ncbi:hypothetical protein, fragment [Candidatus Vecturithrix granuli]|uniref:Xylose isomerase-like TIM barrel domain-containing protein n=1 Tax=Vecturithrix granuli TaxID=1499967 RepID=A0A081C5L4_VECG1|nr:hypothetical protein, fragment [Candidatus Vecturithrix granuli]
MLHSGLVSITFRQLSPQEIIKLIVQAGLEGIEWGGDIHAPHGNFIRAREVRRMTTEAGLHIAAYGSYYRAGHEDSGPFAAVLETALELEAPLIRVWAGIQGTDTADAAYFHRVVEDSQRIAELSAQAGIGIAYEFHANTLTDTNEAASRLLNTVAHENIASYWQPPRYSTVEYNLAGLAAVLPWLQHIHVFNWHIKTGERLFLAEAEASWRRYFKSIAATGRDHFAMLEFVKDDAPEVFLQDAATLKKWLVLVNREMAS